MEITNYRVVAIIPIKGKSERVKNKNFKPINSTPLYQFFLSKIQNCHFDEIYVDTDSEEIKDYSLGLGYKVIDRLHELATNTANGNDLLVHHGNVIDADIYFQLFITCPLMSADTVNKAIKIMQEQEEYDSLFTAYEIYSWFWFHGCAVNYDPKVLPRSQEAKPIIRETTGLYAIRKEALKKYNCRIGENPYMLFVDFKESIDLDDEVDFKLAEFFLNN